MARNKDACFSHVSDDWKTPSDLYNLIVNVHNFVDVFPYKCSYDQLKVEYKEKTKLFINPPYSKLRDLKYSSYLIDLIKNGHFIIMLIPSRTDTIYFHEFLEFKPKIYFFKGRLKFNDIVNGAPFPSMLLIFNICFKTNDWNMYDYFDFTRFCHHMEYWDKLLESNLI